jgi:hypothetical protein
MNLLPLLWFLLIPLSLMAGVYLIWRQTGILRILGWLLLLLWAYYRLQWISPLFVLGGSDRVQEFKLNRVPFGSFPTVRWMEATNQLLLVPDEKVIFRPEIPESNHVLVVDLETRKSQWQPKAEVNLDETRRIEFLWTGYSEQRDGLNLYYASPSKVGPRTESRYFGFSLPILVYQIPWPMGGAYGWQWQRTDFGFFRDVVRESDSSPSVVAKTTILFNAQRELAGGYSAWVMEGKFLIVQPFVYIDPRVLVFGPFNTPQNTQSENNQHKE